MSNRLIYLDHAAATSADPAVVEVMRPYFSDFYGNPSSLHALGLKSKNALDAARQTIAKALNAHIDEIIFTSGGTEADNLAIIGLIRANSTKETKPHIITGAIEHHAVLEPLTRLQKDGDIELTVLSVDRDGLVDPAKIKTALKPSTILVSIMAANNEIGTIQPIADIGRIILAWRKEHNTPYPLFHTDACQAVGALDLNVEQSHVDLLSLSGSKIYGPKGSGALFIRRNVKINPLVRGGGQERNLRSGTENVPAIVGLAKAVEIAEAKREKEKERLTKLRDRLIEGLLAIPKTRLNGHATKRLPNNVNISFLDLEGEAAVLYLDAQNILASTGSACASSSLDPSHVIIALGLPYEAAHGALRFTLGRDTTAKDVETVIKIMPGIAERLRKMSPTDLDMKYYD